VKKRLRLDSYKVALITVAVRRRRRKQRHIQVGKKS
jgi:hypothetical protein